jgi:hypothetical protein
MPIMVTVEDYQMALMRPRVPLLGELGARLELDHSRRPAAMTGSSSVVFRLVTDGDGPIAVRVPRDPATASDWHVRYAALRALSESAFADRVPGRIAIHRQGLSVADGHGDIRAVPALSMQWLEGPTLAMATDRAARGGNTQVLSALARAVIDLANLMRKVGFVHGDLSATNIIVGPDGKLRLVDLDTAFWPGAPLGATGSGTAGWRHPQGAASSERRDGFPILILYTSLLALVEDPDRRRSWGDPVSTPDGTLLFSEWDLANPDTSDLFHDLSRRSGGRVAEAVASLRAHLASGPESIETALRVIPNLEAMRVPAPGDAPDSWSVRDALKRAQQRFERGAVPTDRPRTATPEPVTTGGPVDDERAALDALRRAIRDRNEGEVARLWAAIGHLPAAKLLRLDVEELFAEGLATRIAAESRSGHDEGVLNLAGEAQMRSLPLPVEARRRIRDARERLRVRATLQEALASDTRDELVHLAMSGSLVILGDTDRSSLERVLQAIEWPVLQRALEADDDRLILQAFDEELFRDKTSLPAPVYGRIELARSRLQWADRMRAALRQRLAGEVAALHDSAPQRSDVHLGPTERRRVQKLVEQHRALRQLAEAIQANDESDIVQALSVVERVGARLGEHFPWHQIRDVLERVSLIEDIREAADSIPADHVKLAQLIPAAKALGLDADPRLTGDYAIEVLQRKVIQAAHLKRVRMAIARGDEMGIVVTALPDVYDVLDLLTEEERDRIARSIRSQRLRHRDAIAARFETGD